MTEETMDTNGAIQLVEHEGWFTIERVEHDNIEELRSYKDGTGGMYLFCSSRVSDACVEGDAADMTGIAQAIKERAEFEDRRCAVEVVDDFAYFWSPRNSSVKGKVPLKYADELSKEIFKRFKGEG